MRLAASNLKREAAIFFRQPAFFPGASVYEKEAAKREKQPPF
jgi:hypothetical protein